MSLGDAFYSLNRGIRNIIRWTPVIWRDEDYDWAYLARIMEFKFRNMSEAFKEGHLFNSEKDARELLICAELLKRLQADDFGEPGDIIYRLHEERMRGWQNELGRMIGRRLRCWWD